MRRAGKPGRGDSGSAQIWEVFPEEVPFELLLLPGGSLRIFKTGKVWQVEEGIVVIRLSFAKDWE